MRRTLPIGLLLSTDGTYRRMARHALAGARDALAEINADPQLDFQLAATHCNPRGELSRYGEATAALMQQGVRHLFGTITSGAPYTYTFDVNSSNALFGRAGNGESPYDNNPLYIPTLNDSAVVYASGFDVDAFNTLIDEQGVTRGEIMDVNSLSGRWNQRWDFRFQQDLPGIPGADRWVGDNRLKLVFDVENVMNLINDEWGTYSSGISNGQAAIVSADLVSAADVAANGIDAAAALTGDLKQPGAQGATFNQGV